jgi:hypothetical protein
MAALGLPVWVNTTYANSIRQGNTKQNFRRWIGNMTRHNGKMGVNTSVLKARFELYPKPIKLVSGSEYREFNQLAKSLYGNSDALYPTFSETNIDLKTIERQQNMPANFTSAINDDAFRG